MSTYIATLLDVGCSPISSPGQIFLQQQNIAFQLLLEPNTEPPVFTPTCVTNGGPPTTVVWTRDDNAIDYLGSNTFISLVPRLFLAE